VQRRIARQPFSRAGKKHHNGFDPVGHPDRNAITADQSVFAQVRRHAINPLA
jgi:hypothetical protein